MKANKIFLAVDLGASSGRVVAGIFDGESLRLVEHHRFSNGPVQVSGRLHWDILRIFSEIKQGIQAAVREHPGCDLTVGVDAWGTDYSLVDVQGNLIGNPFHYRDQRVEGIHKTAHSRLPLEELYRKTGIQYLFFNTLYQALADLQLPCADRAERLLFIPDLIHFWLTGIQVNEYTIASTSQLLDPHSRDWSRDVIDKIGLPRRWFRNIVSPGTVIGPLSRHLQDELGCPALQVIAPGCHDTASAVAAVPATGSPHAFISSGTWSLMGVELEDPVIGESGFHAGFSNEGGVCGTIRFLKNISGLWLLQECRRVWADKGRGLTYPELIRLGSEAQPFSALIDPDAAQFQTPGDMPRRIEEYCNRTGQTPPSGPGETVRCILESLALKYRWVMDRIEELTGFCPQTLHIVGGGTQNELLSQFACNAVNKQVVTGPVEATSVGNILMQLLAAGEIHSLEQGRELVRRSFQTRSLTPEHTKDWSDAYVRFARILE